MDAEPLSDPGKLLRNARQRAGLSQRQMAERAGVRPAMISAYERNLRDPTIGTLQRLLEAVGVTLTGQLAPSDAGLDAAVRAALGQSPVERVERFDIALGMVCDLCAGLPYVVRGLAAAAVQGAPVTVTRVEVRLGGGDDVVDAVAARACTALAHMWRPDLRYFRRPSTADTAADLLRRFNPTRWREIVGGTEFELALWPEDDLGPPVEVPFGERRLHVTPLWELELSDAKAAKVLRRTREILSARSEAGR